MEQLTFVDFDESLAGYFGDFNRRWLEKYFYVEPIDEAMLSNPKLFFIDKGGYIFFAKLGNEIAGTFALMKIEDGVYELSKMAVDEKYHGRKIGNQLLAFCLQKANELKARKIILYSNTKLENAIHLYRKYGFKEVPIGNSEYKRSNIKMELITSDNFIKAEQVYEQNK